MQSIIGRDFPKIVIPKINEAKTSIKIVVFDWRWYPNDASNPVQQFNHALISAVHRGVSVSAIANSSEIINILKQNGVNAKKLITKNLVHCKLMIIDDKIVIIGSHNYTQYAFTMNYEISCLHEDSQTANDFVSFFASLFCLS